MKTYGSPKEPLPKQDIEALLRKTIGDHRISESELMWAGKLIRTAPLRRVVAFDSQDEAHIFYFDAATDCTWERND